MGDSLQRVGLVFEESGAVNFKKTLSDTSNALANNRNQFKLTQMQWDENTKASEKLRAEANYLSTQYDNQGVRVQALRQKLEELENSDNANEKQIAATRKQLLNAEVAYQKMGNELDDVNKKLTNGKVDLEEYAKKIGEVGDKAKDVGGTLTKTLTAGVAAVGTAAVAAWKEMDDAYDNIISITGATADAADSLSNSFDNVYSSLPTDSETASDAIASVYQQFGFMDDQLEEASTSMIKYASINKTDVVSSAKSAKQAIEAYSLANSDLSKILDATTKVSQNTGVSVDELMDKAVTGAPQIKALGLSFQEGVTLMGQFEKSGVDSAAALSSLSKASVVYAADGKTLTQGLSETQNAILNAKDETEALNIAAGVFGTKGAVRMVDAIQRGTINLEDLATAAEDTGGVVTDTFDATLDPADNATLAYNNLKLALSKLGDTIQSSLGPILEKLATWLKSVSDWFSSLSTGQKNTILVIGGLVAAIGPLLVIFGTLAGSLSKIILLFTSENTAMALSTIQKGLAAIATGAMTVAQTALNVVVAIGTTLMTALGTAIAFLTSPIGLIILAIVALIAIFVLLWNKCEGFRNFFINLWDNIQKVLSSFSSWLGKMFATDWTKSFGIIGNFMNAWMANISNIVGAIKKIFSGIVDFVTGIFTGNWSKAWDGVKKIFGGAFDGLLAIAKVPLNGVIGFLNTVIDALNVMIKGLNKIQFDVPSWVPVIGGKKFGFNVGTIGKLNYLAKGGTLTDGMAIIAEAGPELLINKGGKSHVIPTSNGGGANAVDLIDYEKLRRVFLEVIQTLTPTIILDKRSIGYLRWLSKES